MRVFAKTNHLPALVHCAHGKDRTGVVIMLLLMACGVPHEAIVQDYVQVRGLSTGHTSTQRSYNTMVCIACTELVAKLGWCNLLLASGIHMYGLLTPYYNSCPAV